MKKFISGAMIALAATAFLSSCEKPDKEVTTEPSALATPQVTATVESDIVTVSWSAVENAATYSYTVDGAAAVSTEQTSFTLQTAELSYGQHQVSVTALPADGSEEFLASKAGTATFTIEDTRVKLATPEVEAESDGDVATVSWSAVEGAATYSYSLNGAAPVSVTDVTLTFTSAELGGGQFEISVKALPEEGSGEYLESDAGTAVFALLAEPSADLQAWLGEYTLTSSHSVVFTNNGGSLGIAMEETPQTATISIERSYYSDYVFIYGFSKLEGYPVYGAIFTNNETGEKYLGILTESAPISKDSEGNDMVVLPVSQVEDGTITFVTGCDYAFLFDSNLNAIPYASTLSDERAFTVVAADVYSVANGSVSIYYSEYPVYLPAGSLSLSKSGTSSANASVELPAAEEVTAISNAVVR